MSTDTQAPSAKAPIQIGVILCSDIAENAVPALKFLLLQLNTLQDAFEYQCLPLITDPLLSKLASGNILVRSEVHADFGRFSRDYFAYLESEIAAYDLNSSKPKALILVSRACLDDEYYMTGEDNVSVLALGHWDRVMAPPSLVEFILTLVVSCSIYALPNRGDLSHYGTKGCLFDFNADLSNARFMALQGFICSECRLKLQGLGNVDLADDLSAFLSKKWLGQISDPTSPAGIASKLGYDLFATKGLTPRWSEKLLLGLKEDGVKEMIRIVGEVLLALLLIFLGLKEISKPAQTPSAQVSPAAAATPSSTPKPSPVISPR
jgi:hypothetical protein